MNGLPYYKRYPRDFMEGTIGMPFELKGAYALVLDLIYMQGGRLPDDARYIAGLLGCSTKAWTGYRAQLIERGKIVAVEGSLRNNRADVELETLAKLSRTQSEKRKGKRKTKDLQEPQFDHTESEPDIRERTTSSHGSAPAARPPAKFRIPADWRPSDVGLAYAREAGLPDDLIREEMAGFVVYWTDRRDRDASKSPQGWELTWRNRVRDVAGRLPRKPPTPPNGPRSRNDERLAAWFDAARSPREPGVAGGSDRDPPQALLRG